MWLRLGTKKSISKVLVKLPRAIQQTQGGGAFSLMTQQVGFGVGGGGVNADASPQRMPGRDGVVDVVILSS